jgi:hypothetical protein
MLLLLFLTLTQFVATTGHTAASLQQENDRLRSLNERLRAYIQHVQSTTSLSTTPSHPSSSTSFLQLVEEPPADLPTTTDGAELAASGPGPGNEDDASGPSDDEEAANKKAIEQSVDNFCLSPGECQERLYACRRHAVEKCWQTDYARGGAKPGSGDLDQDRLQQINDRTGQKLREIGIDIDCDPSASGVNESVALSGGPSGSKDEEDLSGGPSGTKDEEEAPVEASPSASSGNEGEAGQPRFSEYEEFDTGTGEGVVKLT